MELSGQVYAPAALPPGKNPLTHWVGRWVGMSLINVFINITRLSIFLKCLQYWNKRRYWHVADEAQNLQTLVMCTGLCNMSWENRKPTVYFYTDVCGNSAASFNVQSQRIRKRTKNKKLPLRKWAQKRWLRYRGHRMNAEVAPFLVVCELIRRIRSRLVEFETC
jgi:hypothetical protein